ncbi:unannotated protein [freshwater metagenome]|uniref:Unannotated protein n=1 Tax=freshwater metagenome TaxID=449393 RepID=A0A6J7Q9S3_9ZZZZ
MLTDDLHHLADSALQIVVDDHMVGDRHSNRFLVERLLQALANLVLGVAAATQPAFLLLP